MTSVIAAQAVPVEVVPCDYGAGSCPYPSAYLYHGLLNELALCPFHTQEHKRAGWAGTWIEELPYVRTWTA